MVVYENIDIEVSYTCVTKGNAVLRCFDLDHAHLSIETCYLEGQ